MRILLAIDGSASSQTAIELTESLPWVPGTIVRVLRAVEPYAAELGAWDLLASADGQMDERARVIEAEEDVEATAARLRSLGLRTEHVVVLDHAGTAIVGDAERHRPDLVIVGSHGHSGIDRFLLGSVSADVVDHSPVPVLVARRPRADRVLVAVDGSAIAFEAVDTVARWPILAHSHTTVMSVIPVSTGWWRAIAAGEQAANGRPGSVTTSAVAVGYQRFAAEGAARLGAVGLGASSMVRCGRPADEVIACAQDLEADLIVVASHGRTGLSRLVMGSVARTILNRASCSVLIVRRHPEPATRKEVSHALASGLLGA